MGAVYEAEHQLLGKHVAVKLLHAQYASDVDVVRRFLNEARAAAMIGHPNILECSDMGRTDEGAPFLVLELLEGCDLATQIRVSGPMNVGRAVGIALAVCAALRAAHEREIIHRDVKPENVFLAVGEDGTERVKVLDFGISKFGEGKSQTGPGTATGQMLGTPAYMAPEQIHDASRVDRRTDVYAVGVLLYQMLSARFPFYGDTLPLLLIKIATEAPTPIAAHRPDLPPGLSAAITCALEKSPDDRFASVEALASAISPFLGVDAPAPGIALTDTLPAGSTPMVISSRRVPTQPPPPGRPRPSTIAAIVVVALAVVGGGVAAWRGSGETPESPAGPRVAETAPTPPPASAAITPPAEAPPSTVRLTVRSTVEGATLTLRGVEHALPFDDEVGAGSAPELLEVSARGREGRRYWVELDRAVVLDVDLPRGRGVRDGDAREAVHTGEGGRALASPTPPSTTSTPPASAVEAPAPTRVPPPPTGVYAGPTGDIPESI